MRRNGRGLILALVLAVAALAGCAGGPASSNLPDGAGPTPSSSAEIVVVDDADDADLVLYVSNQSFEHDTVRIEVAVDGVLVVDREFAVEGQHSWIEFPLTLPPGEHTLTAATDTDVIGEYQVDLPDGERRWAVLDYWYYPETDDGSESMPPSFTFDVSDEQVAFA